MEDLQTPKTTSELSSKRKSTTWTTTQETTRRYDSWDRNRPPCPNVVVEYDDDDDDWLLASEKGLYGERSLLYFQYYNRCVNYVLLFTAHKCVCNIPYSAVSLLYGTDNLRACVSAQYLSRCRIEHLLLRMFHRIVTHVSWCTFLVTLCKRDSSAVWEVLSIWRNAEMENPSGSNLQYSSLLPFCAVYSSKGRRSKV
jgi:hypothetical protein